MVWYIAIVIDKARFSAFTHDESGTYLHYAHKPFLDFFTKMETWDMANNHLLNTLLINFSTSAFGVHEWSLRLPNILAAVFYCLSIFFIKRLLSLKPLAAITLFIVMAFHPLLHDLFTVARGYGLCLCMASWSSYFLLKYYTNDKLVNVLYCTLFCAAAVYANFIAIHYYLAIGAVLLIININKGFDKMQTIKSLLVFGSIGLLCFLSIVKILFRLDELGEFKWGTSSLSATCTSFITEAIFNGSKYGSDFPKIMIALFISLFIGMAIVLFKNFKSPLSIYLILLIGMLALPILFHYLVNAHYPDARKTILYYPLFGIAVFSIINSIPQSKWQHISTVLVIIFFTQHFARNLIMRNTREWWYDKSNKLVIDRINQTKEVENPKVGCNWLFMPALEMYRTTCKPFTNVPLIYNKEMDTVNYYHYYYVLESDTSVMMHKYFIDTQANVQSGQLLLRLRNSFTNLNP
jgi:hypothetical protein